MSEESPFAGLLRPPGLYKVALILFVSFAAAASLSNNRTVHVVCIIGSALVAVGLTVRYFLLIAQRFFVIPKRLIELMATICFTGIVSTVSMLYFPRGSYESFLGLGVAFIWAFGGAAWAWHRVNKIGEVEANTRLLYFAAGWAGLVGALGLIAFVFSLIHILNAKEKGHDFTPEEQRGLISVIKYSCMVLPLVVPMIMIEYRARKQA
jgi:hypothetical protein